MKHIKLLLLTVLLAFVSSVSAFAYDFEVDGIYYNVKTDQDLACEVTSGTNKYSGSIVIPSSVFYNEKTYSVTKIGDNAFKGCSDLISLVIGNSVTEIGKNAVRQCTSLTSVEVPNSVVKIGEYAFNGCTSLTSAKISNSVVEIGSYAFSWCSNLTSIAIGNSVASIGSKAFYYCPSLESFTGEFASSDHRCLIIEGELKAFAPAGLTSYTVPNSVTEVGHSAFAGCENLVSVKIPNSVTKIGGSAFSQCKSLLSVELPDFITEIGSYTFDDCTSLTSVQIPSTVSKIGKYAFDDCESLEEIVSMNTTPPTVYDYTFKNVSKTDCVVKVSYLAVAAYKNATGWSEFENIVAYDESTTPDDPTTDPTTPDDPSTPEVTGNFRLYIEDQEVTQGKSVKIPVMLSNDKDVVTFQCDITLPEGVSVETDSRGKYKFELSERSDGHSLFSSKVEGEKIRVGCYSNDNYPFIGNDGELLYIPLLVSESVNVGDILTLGLTNISITTYQNNTLSEVELPDSEAKLTVIKAYTPGDVNGDGKFTTTDIALTVEYVLGRKPANGIEEAADVNNDGKFTTTDIALIVSYILNSQK